jgi:tetratricopeptide (TPR) repeat protein
MQKLLLALSMVMLLTGFAHAHGNISKLPDSVQILQYKMKLYMNEDDAETKNNLAMVYVRTGQLPEAKEQLVAILEQDPHNFNALDEMGVVLVVEGNGEKALEFLQRAQTVNDKDLMLYVHLSLAHELSKQTELAGKAMDRAKAQATGPEDLTKIDEEITFITAPKN